MAVTPFSSVDEILVALETLTGRSSQDVDDVVPAQAHLLQTAELLASSHPDDPDLVAAGLVHDIASALHLGEAGHERLGAALVAPVLGERVGTLVASHVNAKRYLVAIDSAYGSVLSETSTISLRAQGGAMDDAETESFREGAHWEATVALRRADDAAKVPGAPVRPVAGWRSLLEAVASQ